MTREWRQFFLLKKEHILKILNDIQQNINSTQQHLCAAEDIMLLNGGVLF